MNYTKEAINENKIMKETENMLSNAVANIEEIMSGEGTESETQSSSVPEEPEKYLLKPTMTLTRR